MATLMFISTFGLALSMRTDKMGNMTDCPLMRTSETLCPMSPIEHIAQWQQLFTAIQQNNSTVLLAAMLVAAAFFLPINRTAVCDSLITFLYRRHKRGSPATQLYNYLLVAFSDGILHPKLYA